MENAPIAIGDMAEGIRGVSYKPEQLRDDANDGSYYLLRSNNIQNGSVVFEDVQIVDKACVKQKQRLREGDIVVCMSNGSRQLVGKNALIKTIHENYCVGAFCSAFRVKSGINPQFVFQVFQSETFKQKIDVILSGSAINNLRNNQIEELKFDLPSNDTEQTRIAEILSTVDEAIAATEALIAKYSRIKTGLLQDLLTRGIDEKGNIRSKATHRFVVKNGIEVPEEWEVEKLYEIGKLGDYLKTGPFGSSLKISDWVDVGVPVVTIGSIGENTINQKQLLYISQEKAHLLSSYKLYEGDILFSRVADIGRSVVISKEQSGWIMSSNFMRLRLNNLKILSHFLQLNLLANANIKSQLRQNANSGGRDVVNSAILNSLYFPIPQRAEQLVILQYLNSISNYLKEQLILVSKQRAVKIGLMQDLLTRKVRVPTKEEVSCL